MHKGFVIIHPNYQLINQHIALSHAYEGKPRETISSSRWEKDMTRYDMLYESYPLFVPFEQFAKIEQREIEFLDTADQCLTGLAALVYWVEAATKLGFKSKSNLGSIDKTANICGPVALYMNDIKQARTLLKKHKFFNRQLDHLPQSVVSDNYEIFDNKDTFIAAHKEPQFYVANLQTIMVYFLTRLLVNKSKNKQYFYGYLACRDLIEWAAKKMYENPDDKFYPKLLPTVEYYGLENNTESYLLNKQKNNSLKPRHMYNYHLKNGVIAPELLDFDYSKSWVFDLDGEPVSDFLDE